MSQDLLEQKQTLTLQRAVERQPVEKRDPESHVQKLQQFTETLCHELRSPLQGVLGHSELLKGHVETLELLLKAAPNVDPQITAVLASIKSSVLGVQASAELQVEITNQVLDLAKIEANKIELTLKPFFLNETIYSVIAILEAQFNAKNIGKIIKLLEKDKQFLGDATRISQILLNLLANALKFTHEGGYVELSVNFNTYSDFTEIRFTLTDTGVGMTEEESRHLFNKFYQVQHENNSNSSGSGLGLCIAKNLIELMQGSILVKSQKWKGTTFEFTIRCQEPSPQLSPRTPPRQHFFANSRTPSPGPTNNKLHILIVEDNETNQHIIGAFLTRGGHTYAVAKNGKEALELYEKEYFNLILMDIWLPGMNGIEITQQIRLLEKTNPGKPPIGILGLSAATKTSNIENALSAGMNGYLTKPVLAKDLLEKISTLFRPTVTVGISNYNQ